MNLTACVSTESPRIVNGYEIRPDANLAGAKLAGAKLSNSYLSWANLIGANLAGANLARADLSFANLRNVTRETYFASVI